MRKIIFLTSLYFTLTLAASGQITNSSFASVGYGIENRFGFRGLSIGVEEQFDIADHFSGIAGLHYFSSNRTARFSSAENEGVYFRQFLLEAKMQYSSAFEPGQGFLANLGIATRRGKTHHFDSWQTEDEKMVSRRFVQEKLGGNGFVLGLGYGARLGETVRFKVELNNYAIATINEQYQLSFKVGF